MILDYLLDKALGITPLQRKTLIGEKPIGAKLGLLSPHLASIPDKWAREAATQFWELANETKAHRNRCFHGVWGFRCMSRERVVPAATHFKAADQPFRATQLPALEKKLCKTANIGLKAMAALHEFPINTVGQVSRLFHGEGQDPPAWLEGWKEQHPMDDDSLDRKWKPGQLPFLTVC
jgi:hypothetical protein